MKFVQFLLPSDAAFSPPVAERKASGSLASWHLGILTSWHLGILASWHLGILASWHLVILATGGLIFMEYCTHCKYVTMIEELTALKFLKVLSTEMDPAQIGLIR